MPSIALRCSAGTSDKLQVVNVNDDLEPFELSSDVFEGRLAVRIKDFHGTAKGKEVLRDAKSGYFSDHPKVTWSMQLQARFLQEQNGDDVVFGNIFQKPIRDYLPYGTGAALKFVRYIDPSLEQDVYADKPWAWSPLIATMNYVNLQKGESKLPEWSAKQPEEDVTAVLPDASNLKGAPDARRKYFSKAERRKEVKLGPDTIVTADFCNGFINFDTLSLKLYAGFEIPLASYWDGQPVTFIAQSRSSGQVFFKIEFTIVDDAIIKEKQAKGHQIESATSETETDKAEGSAEAQEEETPKRFDVDTAGGVD